jgi:hypothetical protein
LLASSAIVTVAPEPSDAGVTKLTVQLVNEFATTVVGETVADVTAPVGVPIV